MAKIDTQIENLLSFYPNEREELLPYIEKAKQYSTECGCAMGARFLAAAFGIFLIYFISVHNYGFVNILKQWGLGMLFIFVSSILGKFIGIALARIRLELLYHQLLTRFSARGE